MDSESEIPASQPTASPTKVTSDKRRKKRKNWSLGNSRKQSTVNQSESVDDQQPPSSETVQPSTSHSVINLAGVDSVKNLIYLDDDDESEPGLGRLIIPADYDIYKSAKIMEMGNVPLTQSEINAIRASQKIRVKTQEPISVRQYMEMEQHVGTNVSASSSKSPFESKMPGNCETQFSSVCNLLDEAHQLIENDFQFSEWPTEHDQTENKMPESVRAILEDFDVESSDLETPKTPPRLLLKKPNRKYSRRNRMLNATEPVKVTVSVISSTKFLGAMTSEEAGADADDSASDEEIDLNASFMIQKNIADLSGLFESQLQPQKIELELNDIVFEQGSQSGDEPLSLSGQSSESDECETARNQTNVASLLSEDEDYFYDYATPRIPSAIKATKRNRETMISEFAQPTVSTPSTSKAVNKGTSLYPKRLRFECDQNPVLMGESLPTTGFAGGFKTALGTGIPAQKMKKSATIFDEILADFDGLPNVEESDFSSFGGFKSALKVNVDLLTIDDPTSNGFRTANLTSAPSSSSGFGTARIAAPSSVPSTSPEFRSAHIAGPMPAPATSNGFRTALISAPTSVQSTSTGLKTACRANDAFPPIDELAMLVPGIPSTSAGFKTGRGTEIQLPTDTAMKKTLKLFDFGQDGFDPVPRKHIKWKDEFDAFDMSNVSAIEKPTTAIDTSINVSGDTFKKYAALFEEEINEGLLGQCEGDTSAVNRSMNFAAASPLHKSIPMKFLTSTPNVATEKPSLDDSSIGFLNQLDEQEFDEMFTTQLQKPSNPELQRTCLADRLNQSIVDSEFNPSIVPQNVIIQRKEALVRQQTNCLRKNNIRPQPGALCKKKSEGNKMVLKELGTPKAYSCDQLAQFGVPPNVINVDIDSVDAFKFEMWRYCSIDECVHNVNGIDLEDGIKLIMDENSCVGFDELSSGFLECDSVDAKLVPDNWIRNSLKWIVLKLAGLERSFPQKFAGMGLTPANVMMQLKYRYDREIDRSQRSAIRKIVEQDDVASKPLVLFVSRIKKTDIFDYSMELSDGWYGIGSGALDPVLTNAIRVGKIRVGTKLLIQDAVLIGVEEACSPLEMPSSAALKFSANSSRRVKWHTKLGYFNGGRSISFPMKSIDPNGGNICKFMAFVVRIYPMLFVVKIQQPTDKESPNNSRTVVRSEKVQRRLDATENKKRFDIIEALHAEVTAEVEREYEAKRKESFALPKREISLIDDAEELWQRMECSYDAESFENELSDTQKTMICTYRARMIQEKDNEISQRVRDKLDKEGASLKARPLLKIRIVDCEQPTASHSAILSIWNANEYYSDLRENSFVEVTSVCASGLRGKDLQITANGRTKIRNVDTRSMTAAHLTVLRKCYHLADINDDSFKPNFNEFDTVAYVLYIEPISEKKFQTVYFVDGQHNILHVKFWKEIKQYAFDDVIEVGKILAIVNLDWRPTSAKSKSGWPQAFVGDLTTFSVNPKSPAMVERLRQLADCFKGMENEAEYREECMSMIHERRDTRNTSSNSTTVLSASNSSPMNQTLNTSKAENVKKSRGKIKMERLKVYKSPPAPPAMNVSHTSISTLRRPFKSPMVTTVPIKIATNQENET